MISDDLKTVDGKYDRGLQKEVADDPPVGEWWSLIIDHDDNGDFHNYDGDDNHNDNDENVNYDNNIN